METKSTIADLVDQNAEKRPNDFWLSSPDTRKKLTWKEVSVKVNEIAKKLNLLGIIEGSSVAVASPNSISSCLMFLGITYGSYMATPLNLVSGSKAMAYVIEHSETKLIFVAKDSLKLVKNAIVKIKRNISIIILHPEDGPLWPQNIEINKNKVFKRPNPNDTALLMYTSGTTGNPKGVELSHKNLISSGVNVKIAHNINKEDIGLCVLPIYHINGLCVTVMGTLVSASGLVMPYRFSNSNFWNQIISYNCSWFSAVPTLFAYLLNNETVPEIDKSRLRFARSASAPLSPEIHRQFEKKFGIPIIETMGLTETGAQILSNPLPPKERKIGSPGVAVGNEIIIADNNLQPLPTGTIGEILVRGDNVMKGYLKQSDETYKTINSEGWLKTGDLGYMDKDEFVFVTGRIKELIVKGGENIAPREIDEVLLEHKSVLEAAAIGVPCDIYGQNVEACIRLKNNYSVSEKELIDHCNERLGSFKAPSKIHIMFDLPKGPSGKIQRMKLLEIINNKIN